MRFLLRGYMVSEMSANSTGNSTGQDNRPTGKREPGAAERRAAEESSFNANRLMMLIFAHIAITLILPRVWTVFGNGIDMLISFVLGILLVSFWDFSYLRRIFWMAIYAVYLVWQIVIANFQLAWIILHPKPELNPGIIAVPLRVRTGLEITTLASSISLTPGTLSIDLGENDAGERVLYVHTLVMEEPATFCANIQNGFENLILRVTRD